MIYEPDFGDRGRRDLESKSKPNVQNQKLCIMTAHWTQKNTMATSLLDYSTDGNSVILQSI